MRPSIIAHAINGILMIIAVIIMSYELFYNKHQFDNTQLFYIIIITSTAVGVHGISHALQEKYYGFNPLQRL